MSTLQTLIDQMIVELNDPNQNTYTTPELTVYLNYGYRMLRRSIYEIRPRLLQEADLTGTLSGNTIVFPKSIMRIIDFRLNYKQIFEVVSESHHHGDSSNYGANGLNTQEYGFILEGFNSVKITPYPQQSAPFYYDIQWTAAIDQSLGVDDDTGLDMGWEDMLTEFAVARAGMRNGADVGGETSLATAFKQQIEENLENMGGPRRSTVKGYQRMGGHRLRW